MRFIHIQASLKAQLVKNLPAMRETWVRSLGWEDPLEKATYSILLAWRIPWTEYRVAKSQTWLRDFQFHYTHIHDKYMCLNSFMFFPVFYGERANFWLVWFCSVFYDERVSYSFMCCPDSSTSFRLFLTSAWNICQKIIYSLLKNLSFVTFCFHILNWNFASYNFSQITYASSIHRLFSLYLIFFHMTTLIFEDRQYFLS